MKKLLLAFSAAVICVLAISAKGDSDHVLMTVNKKPVKASEFEYLYRKNNTQQATVQPIDEYLDLFVVYKLKVAAAEAAGIDQAEAFKNEFAGYRRDLSEPYLTDEHARDSIVRLIYDRLAEEVKVSHIMINKGANAAEAANQKAKLDSLRNEIIAGNVDFAAAADQYSIDPSVVRNHGDQGYVSSGMFPYTFEDAVFETAVGDISPVIETPFGYHIVKVFDRRKNPGMVKVQHILKLTVDLPEAEQAIKKHEIDSIYALLKSGADFDSIAVKESEDPGSARMGGNLDWFGTGRMVPEFEKVSYELKNGEISEPVRTSYGWHIVKRLDWKGLDPFEVLEPRISDFIDRDERRYIPVRIKQAQLRKKYEMTVNNDIVEAIRAEIVAAGGLDSALVAQLSEDNREIISLKGDNQGATVSDVFEVLPPNFSDLNADQAFDLINKRIDDVATEATTEAERNNLYFENAEYRNLLNEYRDGMLLFEISDQNVWSKSKNDVEGLNAFFEANKQKYATWKAPKFKGYVVFATSDSIKTLAEKYLADNEVEKANLVETMRKQFGNDVRVERVLAAQGDNAIIDGLAFGGEAPALTGKWTTCFAYDGKIIDQPEEPADCRGEVTTDYQNVLEKQWVEQLRKAYPVKINKKTFKKIKAQLEAENSAAE